MEDKIIGLAYRESKTEHTVETYAIIYENNEFLYKPLKKYENILDNTVIDELENTGFKSVNYWYNNLTELTRDNIKNVKK